MIPLLLPNSQYMARNGHDTRGFGVWPAFLGQNRLEIQLTLNTSNYTSASNSDAPATIAGKCSLLYHQVEMTAENLQKYSDLRGNYSIINRRFTELTNDWQHYTAAQASAAEVVRWTASQPQGVCSEIMVIAVATGATADRYSAHTFVKPDLIRVVADSVTQKELDGAHKINCELWSSGFSPPADFPSPGRMCFGCHCGEVSHCYNGGYAMTLASNVSFEIRFPSEVRWKLVVVQYQRTTIDRLGRVESTLE